MVITHSVTGMILQVAPFFANFAFPPKMGISPAPNLPHIFNFPFFPKKWHRVSINLKQHVFWTVRTKKCKKPNKACIIHAFFLGPTHRSRVKNWVGCNQSFILAKWLGFRVPRKTLDPTVPVEFSPGSGSSSETDRYRALAGTTNVEENPSLFLNPIQNPWEWYFYPTDLVDFFR